MVRGKAMRFTNCERLLLSRRGPVKTTPGGPEGGRCHGQEGAMLSLEDDVHSLTRSHEPSPKHSSKLAYLKIVYPLQSHCSFVFCSPGGGQI